MEYKNRPEDFTFEQKEEIIFKTFYKYHLLCPIYGIIKCPSCYCKMALGFEFKKDGSSYYGWQNYQNIHLKMGFKLIPNHYVNISRVHIDHLLPIYQGGTATFENGVMICESCNLIFNKDLTYEEKMFLLNTDRDLMDCDDTVFNSDKSRMKIIQNGKTIFNGKDIFNSILCRRKENNELLEIIPMHDYNKLYIVLLYIF